jgi:hypothetical protein
MTPKSKAWCERAVLSLMMIISFLCPCVAHNRKLTRSLLLLLTLRVARYFNPASAVAATTSAPAVLIRRIKSHTSRHNVEEADAVETGHLLANVAENDSPRALSTPAHSSTTPLTSAVHSSTNSAASSSSSYGAMFFDDSGLPTARSGANSVRYIP